MIRSMTAYARHQSQVETGEILWELRTLNSRYLEINLKLPEEWRGLEPEVRERIGKQLKRGKVDCFFRYRRLQQAASGLVLNRPLVETVAGMGEQIQSLIGSKNALSVSDVMRWPGVVSEEEQDISSLQAGVLSGLDGALQELLTTREREGEKLGGMISERCDGISALVEEVKKHVPDIRSNQEKKMRQRLDELDINVDPHRFEQELVFHLQRLDVHEEIDRLVAHVEEVRQVLGRKESIGRRLDFLMQELNREANTLGSKAANLDIKGVSVELKVLIEQMREQVQNIE